MDYIYLKKEIKMKLRTLWRDEYLDTETGDIFIYNNGLRRYIQSGKLNDQQLKDSLYYYEANKVFRETHRG